MKKYVIIFSLILVSMAAYAGTREQIVATSSTAVAFTKIGIEPGATCVVKNGSYTVFVDWIGSTPTATIGIPLQANDSLSLNPYEFNSFSAIATSTSSTIYGMCN